MYIPKHFLITDREEAISFMQRYSFGTIVTAENNLPVANHLPFIIEQKENQLLISSHFAKANSQALQLANHDVLIMFTEPHAYISPKFYEKDTNVPTWNYLAVHVYGKARVFETEEEHKALLERTIKNYEAAYFEQWQRLPEDYKAKMIKGITGFEITVTDIQAKKKLSQNRTEQERENIIGSFEQSNDSNEREIARYMSSNH